MQKKGELSRLAVNLLIGSLIIILGIVIWIILKGGSGIEQQIFTDENIDLKISQVKKVNDNTLYLTLKRGEGEGEFVGLSFAVSDGSLTEIVRVNTSMPENQTGNFSLNFVSMNASRIKKVSVTPIYINQEGVEVIGNVKDEYVTPNTCSNYCPVGAQCGYNDCGMQCGSGCSSGYLCLNYKCIKQKTSSGGGGGSGGSSGGDSTPSCTDTCSSLGYQCGTRTVCGNSVNCGTCSTGEDCINNICTAITSDNIYYVATNGNDNNPGTINSPFATLQKAIEFAEPGDSVYVRGGTYYPESTIVWDPTNTYVGNGGVDGTPLKTINYLNYPGEKPIFNFINFIPEQSPYSVNSYNTGFYFYTADYINIRGITVMNVKQWRDYMECWGVYAYDSTNLRFENMVIHNVDGNAFRFFGGWRYPGTEPYDHPEHANYPNNTIYFINCDAYNNWDWRFRNEQENTLGGSADGYKIVDEAGSLIIMDGCRAWNNSDDGFDPSGPATIILNNCWSFQNGALDGDGSGFKTGGLYDSNFISRKVTNCVAAENTRVGFFLLEYPDYHRTNARIYNNLAYDNSYGFSVSSNVNYPNPLAIWRNNIAYASGVYPFSNSYMTYTESNNTWRLISDWPCYEDVYNLNNNNFVNLDVNQLKSPRSSDGSLPKNITFGHLNAGSVLIDKGMLISGYHCSTSGAHPGEDCVEWFGTAPDLGPFESNY